MGVKAAEMYIKVKGGHFEHIMETKPIFIVNINCSQSIFSKNYQYHSKNLIQSVHQPLQKLHFQMGHPVVTLTPPQKRYHGIVACNHVSA